MAGMAMSGQATLTRRDATAGSAESRRTPAGVRIYFLHLISYESRCTPRWKQCPPSKPWLKGHTLQAHQVRGAAGDHLEPAPLLSEVGEAAEAASLRIDVLIDAN